MKIYQPRKSEYRLPHNLYMRTIYFIRDYERMKAEHESAYENYPKLFSFDCETGQNNNISDPTYAAFLKAEKFDKDIKAIEKALHEIPAEYRAGVKDSIIHRKKYPDSASTATWSRYKSKFIKSVAQNLGWI